MANQIQSGEQAPSFDILNYDGNVISLSQYAGKKVWLALYRYSACPLCLDHFSEVVAKHTDIRNSGAEFIAVFESKTIDLRSNPCKKTNVYYPMIADPDKRIYNLYGAEENVLKVFHPAVALKFTKALLHGFPQRAIDGAMGRVPAHFLIEPDGKVHTAYYGSHIADNIPWWKVARFLQRKGPAKKNEPQVDPWTEYRY